MEEIGPGRAIKHLVAAFCELDSDVRWRAISAMGPVVARMADRDMDEARNVMRRLMWSLNDESGGIGWGAPEAMATIMTHVPRLADEFSHILVSYLDEDGNFIEHPPLQRGVLWGVGRLAETRPELAGDAAEYLEAFLKSPDDEIRGNAAWAAGMVGKKKLLPALESLLSDDNRIVIYIDNRLVKKSIAELATGAMDKIHGDNQGKRITGLN